MPVTVHKRNGKYRVVEADTGRIAKTHLGNARDGGGHASKAKAQRQARAINAGLAQRNPRTPQQAADFLKTKYGRKSAADIAGDYARNNDPGPARDYWHEVYLLLGGKTGPTRNPSRPTPSSGTPFRAARPSGKHTLAEYQHLLSDLDNWAWGEHGLTPLAASFLAHADIDPSWATTASDRIGILTEHDALGDVMREAALDLPFGQVSGLADWIDKNITRHFNVSPRSWWRDAARHFRQTGVWPRS